MNNTNDMAENIKKLYENGCLLDAIIASFSTVPEDIIRQLYDEIILEKNS